MKRQLLLAFGVIQFLGQRKKRDREMLFRVIGRMCESPDGYSAFEEYDEEWNRLVDVHLVGEYAISFWDDFADRHLKILRVRLADRGK